MSGHARWLHAAHGAAMLSFNLQPSRWLHASRWPQVLPPGWPVPGPADGGRHRHLSALILARLGAAAQPVDDPARPEWPLALCAAPLLHTLLQRLALQRLQRRVRLAIRRDDAVACARHLDRALQTFVREQAAVPESDDATLAEWPLATLLPQLEAIGSGTLLHACTEAPEALRQRLQLRCPAPDTPANWAPLVTPAEALALSLRLLEQLEPQWTSSFPPRH